MRTGMKLNYVMPGGQVIQQSFDEEAGFYLNWLDHMVEANPNTIFFYTVDSTNIWEDEEEPIIYAVGKDVLFSDLSLDKASIAYVDTFHVSHVED